MKRFLKSVSYARNGVGLMLKEPNFRIHLAAAFLVINVSIWLGLNVIEWIIIIGCIATVLAAEIFNTAVEQLCNMTEPNIHPTIKKIKDASAAAVLILAIAAAVSGTIILLPKLIINLQMYTS